MLEKNPPKLFLWYLKKQNEWMLWSFLVVFYDDVQSVTVKKYGFKWKIKGPEHCSSVDPPLLQ